MVECLAVNHCYLNSYHPLVLTAYGRRAAIEHSIPPFVDGSIRREPDLEHDFPSISCLCRKGHFAPRLRVGDIVGYMTTKSRFGTRAARHRRLTAVLRIIDKLASHKAAAEWYCARGLPLPSNCMVADNPAKPIGQSHRRHKAARRLNDEALARIWDRAYRKHATKFKTFLVCRALYRELSWDAPMIGDDHLMRAFGRIPATQNPGRLRPSEFRTLLELLEIPMADFGL